MKDVLNQIKEAGIVGAGGAGFPTYVKLRGNIKTLIVNAVECEPLIQVDKLLLATYTAEILESLMFLIKSFKIEKCIIAVKSGQRDLVDEVRLKIKSNKIQIQEVPSVYPMGDEVILVREVTGIELNRGELPINKGLVILNLETVFNIYKKMFYDLNVTHKYVTITGEVENPGTYLLPIGTPIKRVLSHITPTHLTDYGILMGGPMTGHLVCGEDTIKKNTKALIVLPRNHKVVRNLMASSETSLKRIMTACSQCMACTDMCPRNLMGHDVQPHKLMNAMANGLNNYTESLHTALGCVNCGICELYACHHDLAPRKMMVLVKQAYAKNGVRPSPVESQKVSPFIDHRRIPSNRLLMHLNLSKYKGNKTIQTSAVEVNTVKIATLQHIGAPTVPLVKIGEHVKYNQCLAVPPEDALGVPVHSPMNGVVVGIDKTYIKVERVRS